MKAYYKPVGIPYLTVSLVTFIWFHWTRPSAALYIVSCWSTCHCPSADKRGSLESINHMKLICFMTLSCSRWPDCVIMGGKTWFSTEWLDKENQTEMVYRELWAKAFGFTPAVEIPVYVELYNLLRLLSLNGSRWQILNILDFSGSQCEHINVMKHHRSTL